MKGTVWAVAVVALAFAIAPAFLNGAYANAADKRSATENATVDFDTNYTVDATGVFQFNESINVTDLEDGDHLQQGTDYEWNDSAGSVNWINTSTMTAGNTTELKYNYTKHSDNTRTIEPIMRTQVTWIALLFLMITIGALLQLVFAGGGF